MSSHDITGTLQSNNVSTTRKSQQSTALTIQDVVLSMPAFSARFNETIQQQLPECSSDPLYNNDFDAVAYINQQFPDEHSLTNDNIDAYLLQTQHQVNTLTGHIRSELRYQSTTNKNIESTVRSTNNDIGILFEKVKAIKATAAPSERLVAQICVDISALDRAKERLERTSQVLSSLHMLVNAITRLAEVVHIGAFKLSIPCICDVNQLLNFFTPYKNVEKIKILTKQAQQLKKQICIEAIHLLRHVVLLNLPAHTVDSFPPGSTAAEQYFYALAVIALVDGDEQNKLIQSFCDEVLSTYITLFSRQDENQGLSVADRRLSWFRRELARIAPIYNHIFPREYNIWAYLIGKFCSITRQHCNRYLKSDYYPISYYDILNSTGICFTTYVYNNKGQLLRIEQGRHVSTMPEGQTLQASTPYHLVLDPIVVSTTTTTHPSTSRPSGTTNSSNLGGTNKMLDGGVSSSYNLSSTTSLSQSSSTRLPDTSGTGVGSNRSRASALFGSLTTWAAENYGLGDKGHANGSTGGPMSANGHTNTTTGNTGGEDQLLSLDDFADEPTPSSATNKSTNLAVSTNTPTSYNPYDSDDEPLSPNSSRPSNSATDSNLVGVVHSASQTSLTNMVSLLSKVLSFERDMARKLTALRKQSSAIFPTDEIDESEATKRLFLFDPNTSPSSTSPQQASSTSSSSNQRQDHQHHHNNSNSASTTTSPPPDQIVHIYDGCSSLPLQPLDIRSIFEPYMYNIVSVERRNLLSMLNEIISNDEWFPITIHQKQTYQSCERLLYYIKNSIHNISQICTPNILMLLFLEFISALRHYINILIIKCDLVTLQFIPTSFITQTGLNIVSNPSGNPIGGLLCTKDEEFLHLLTPHSHDNSSSSTSSSSSHTAISNSSSPSSSTTTTTNPTTSRPTTTTSSQILSSWQTSQEQQHQQELLRELLTRCNIPITYNIDMEAALYPNTIRTLQNFGMMCICLNTCEYLIEIMPQLLTTLKKHLDDAITLPPTQQDELEITDYVLLSFQYIKQNIYIFATWRIHQELSLLPLTAWRCTDDDDDDDTRRHVHHETAMIASTNHRNGPNSSSTMNIYDNNHANNNNNNILFSLYLDTENNNNIRALKPMSLERQNDLLWGVAKSSLDNNSSYTSQHNDGDVHIYASSTCKYIKFFAAYAIYLFPANHSNTFVKHLAQCIFPDLLKAVLSCHNITLIEAQQIVIDVYTISNTLQNIYHYQIVPKQELVTIDAPEETDHALGVADTSALSQNIATIGKNLSGNGGNGGSNVTNNNGMNIDSFVNQYCLIETNPTAALSAIRIYTRMVKKQITSLEAYTKVLSGSTPDNILNTISVYLGTKVDEKTVLALFKVVGVKSTDYQRLLEEYHQLDLYQPQKSSSTRSK